MFFFPDDGIEKKLMLQARADLWNSFDLTDPEPILPGLKTQMVFLLIPRGYPNA